MESAEVFPSDQLNLPGGRRSSALSRELRDLRARFAWSQQDLADRVGTSQPTVARWENGGAPQLRFHRELARLLGISASAISDLASQGVVRPAPDEADYDTHAREFDEIQRTLIESLSERVRSGVPLTESDERLFHRVLDVAGFDRRADIDPV